MALISNLFEETFVSVRYVNGRITFSIPNNIDSNGSSSMGTQKVESAQLVKHFT